MAGGTYRVDAKNGDDPPSIKAIFTQSDFKINKDEVENGSLNSKDSAKAEEKVTIQLNVNDGYEVTSLVLKDKNNDELKVEFTDNGDGTYTFIMPSQDVKISAKVEKVYKLSTGKTGDGTVTLTVNDEQDKATAPAGAMVTVTAKPDNGYILKSLTYTGAGGALVPIESGGTFIMPSSDVTVKAEFEEQNIKIIEEGGTGTVKIISQDGETGETRLTVTPHDGYRVKGVYYAEGSGLTRTAADDGLDWILAIPVGTTLATVNTWAFTPSQNAQNIQIKVEYMDSSVKELEISTEEGLRELAASVNAGNNYEGVTITLTDDVELHGEWMPIGKNLNVYEAPFGGTFDGNNKTISGLQITPASEYVDFNHEKNYADCGLFGVLGSGAAVKNLTVSGEINTRVGKVAHTINVGGIAGRAMCNANMPGMEQISITNCVNQVNIDAEEGYVGGIAGYCWKVNITDCVNEGKISIKAQVTTTATSTAAGNVGGIAGFFHTGDIIRCLNKGNITHDAGEFGKTSNKDGVTQGQKAQSGYFAGICNSSSSNANIIDCVNKGSITGDMTLAGGLANMTSQRMARQVENSYSTGSIASTGDHNYPGALGRIGGLYGVGYAAETVKNCYSSGAVTVEYPPVNAGQGAYADDLCGGSFEGAAPTMINCYGLTNITAMGSGALLAKLNEGSGTIEWKGETVDYWKSDETKDADGNTIHLNDGYPMLYWEDATFSGDTSTVTFALAPSSAKVKVYNAGELVQPGSGTAYSLYEGLTYSYTVEADGYVPVSGSLTVNGDEKVSIELKPASIVAFQITPAEADLTVMGSAVVAPDSSTTNDNTTTYVYTLETGSHYIYSVSADGYVGVSREFDATGPQTITVTMEESDYGVGSDGTEAQFIYGDENTEEGQEHIITTSGTYSIGKGAAGVMTIKPGLTVTLIGSGYGINDAYDDLYIDCGAGVSLTLKNVYLSNGSNRANMINFTGSGNTLNFSGTCILDQDTGATGYAMIHVGPSTSLTVTGGTAYLYKREQGAGIGGNGGGSGNGENVCNPEYNGTINISGAQLFIKGSKQGACIGAGADVGRSGSPGPITITNSDLNLICEAQGAGIGTGAGDANSIGPNLTVSNSMININVNFTSAGIGGGGYKTGADVGTNDTDGGRLTYLGNSSIRVYIGKNAIDSWGVSSPGVNGNKAVTANVVNRNGQKLYLLELDTTKLSLSSGIKEGSQIIYSGGLHQWAYINEDVLKNGQFTVNYTIDNWVASVDPCVYLYLTGEPHTLTVDSMTVNVEWTGSRFTYEIVNEDGEIIDSSGETDEEPAVETKSATVIEDGTATTTVDSDLLAEKLEGVEAGTLIIIKPEIPADETIHTTVTVLTRGDVGNIAKAEASLKVSTPLADIFLPNDALWYVAGKEGQEGEKVTITAAVTEDGTCIEVAANNEVMEKVDGGLKATLPVSEGELTAGSVMVLVDEEGKEAVIKKSAPDETGVTALLKGSCTVKVVENAKKFDDVTDGVWYVDPVAFTTSHELFVGISETEFAPEMQMSRAMLVTVLHRLEDTPNAETLNSFVDVPSSWYTDAVDWANENSIVLGYSASIFGPDDNVTREQIAVILYRYMQYLDLDVSVQGKLDDFTDGGETSDWAVEAMEWAVGTGLLEGKGGNILDPTGIASRAEVSAMLQRLITLMVV